ncbi:MAG: DUF4255 domain-containing protein [bacterium]|nr:DUF4255 domain-containing protein [bacterium]
MSASTAIGMISQSLRNLLADEMALLPEVNVTLLGPDEPGGDRRINLFLYQVQESAALRNADWQPRADDPGTLMPPPLSLNLFYLMTAYAANDPQTGNSTAHEILGDAMRVFHEYPIVPEGSLDPGLLDAREEIRVMLHALDLEELSRVWNTFTQPFRLSVLYEVSVVQLDRSAVAERPLAARVRRIGVPEVAAPFAPPRVEDLEPASGPAGTTVTFRGTDLAGWRAYVTVMRRRIADAEEITGDAFEVTLPADLGPGFHELRVDVSHLFRGTFFFEVTP